MMMKIKLILTVLSIVLWNFYSSAAECVGDSSANLDDSTEKYLSEPLPIKSVGDEVVWGDISTPIEILVYSDFECHYCAKGSRVMKELLSKHPQKIHVVYKHFPLPFHRQALLASKYFEALKSQNSNFAKRFHDQVFHDQLEVIRGEEFFIEISRKVGADMKQLKSDIRSKKVSDRVKVDVDEATALGFKGTPSFLVNGVPVSGARDACYFEKLIEKL